MFVFKSLIFFLKKLNLHRNKSRHLQSKAVDFTGFYSVPIAPLLFKYSWYSLRYYAD